MTRREIGRKEWTKPSLNVGYEKVQPLESRHALRTGVIRYFRLTHSTQAKHLS